ncbi:18981_t:CDS:2 [Rhizophagus irregularis]|nr:18981_t:CDS:2 [Rhizophagus irregularis]
MSTPVDDLSDSTTTPTTKSKPKYIQHDLAQELLTSLRLLPLKGEKWLWNGYDVCGVFQDDGNARTPLHIGVVNFHNNLCSRSLPPSMITFIQQQMENDDDDCIFFDDNRQHGITKFVIEVDKEVVEFLENFKIV